MTFASNEMKYFLSILIFFLFACSPKEQQKTIDLKSKSLANESAYIPVQCYADIKRGKSVNNPCYTCHVPSKAPNFIEDGQAQLEYSFAAPARKHKWSNYFVDRKDAIEDIDDQSILTYVREDNYHQVGSKEIALSQILKQVPKAWDVNENGRWDGYIPDVSFDFDPQGFDLMPNGQPSGWRIFAYYPLPGAFMPTNGSTGDVLIRLPEMFRNDEKGQYDPVVYDANLQILNALVSQTDIKTTSLDEVVLKADINGDGELTVVEKVPFDIDKNSAVQFVGQAKLAQAKNEIDVVAGLYPVGVEFAHSVRYIDVQNGSTAMANRFKELRYARKISWRTPGQLARMVFDEEQEAILFPDILETVVGNAEIGINNRLGWQFQGFIEDQKGQLRPQSYEEHAFCMGCHAGVGSITDSIFSYTRRLDKDSFKQSWYHWQEKGLEGIPDRLSEYDLGGEYANYLLLNPTGDDFGSNQEVHAKFYQNDKPNKAAFDGLKNDISQLLMPSPERAIALNKAYRLVVEEQSYRKGRDPVLSPLEHLFTEVEDAQETGLSKARLAF